MGEQVQSSDRSGGQQKVGTVVSTSMAKTIVVEVKRRVAHPLYRRSVTRMSKFYAPYEKRLAEIGDSVRIVECRPLSKLKRWRLVDVVWKPTRADVISDGSEKG